MVGNEG